jgi:VanZ family protein
VRDATRRFWVYSGPAIFYALIVIFATATPGEYIPPVGISGVDKLVHFGMQVVFAWLVHRALLYQENMHFIKSRALIMTFIIGIAFGVIVEWYQMYIPGRQADLIDGLMNALGVIFYCILYITLIHRFWPKPGNKFRGEMLRDR